MKLTLSVNKSKPLYANRVSEIKAENVVGFCLIIFANILIQPHPTIAGLLAIAEVIYVLLQVLCFRIEKAYLAIVVLTFSSLEVDEFVFGQFSEARVYGLTKAPFIGGFGFAGIILLLSFLSYMKYRTVLLGVLREQKREKSLLKLLLTLVITGIVFTMVAMLTNDNNAMENDWYLFAIFTESVSYLTYVGVVLISVILVVCNDGFRRKLSLHMVELLLAGVIISFVSSFVGLHGYYGNETNILLMPLCVSFCVSLIPISNFIHKKNRLPLLICGLFYLVFSVQKGSLMGSKYYIVIALTVFAFFLSSITNKKTIFITGIIICLPIILYNYNYILSMLTGNSYTSWKFNQLINSANILGVDYKSWYSRLGNSPRYRIDEFVNIFIEYMQKPYYLIFGKGFAGTIVKKWGLTNWNVFAGNFSMDQIRSGIYLNMHESINVLFLKNGLLGIVFIISTAWNCVRRLKRNMWATIALVWILFYWGVYLSMIFGAAALALALYDEKAS